MMKNDAMDANMRSHFIQPPVDLGGCCACNSGGALQWGYGETRELVAVCADSAKEAAHAPTPAKRSKASFWDAVTAKMKDRGCRRSMDQYKVRWKEVVNCYKERETLKPENGRQCPFVDQLHMIFSDSSMNADYYLLPEPENGGRPKRKARKALAGDRSSEDLSDEEEDEEAEDKPPVARKRKQKAERERQKASAERSRAHGMQDVLEDFFQQQQRLEMEWREAMERREHERRAKEQEWRERMEALEREHMARESLWREKEEQRREREEARAVKRDTLFTALLARLATEDAQ